MANQPVGRHRVYINDPLTDKKLDHEIQRLKMIKWKRMIGVPSKIIYRKFINTSRLMPFMGVIFMTASNYWPSTNPNELWARFILWLLLSWVFGAGLTSLECMIGSAEESEAYKDSQSGMDERG